VISDLLGISIGYLIFYTTLVGAFTAIVLLATQAVIKAFAIFRPSRPKKQEIPTKSLPVNEDYWICPYCQSENDKNVFICGTCRSPRRHM